MIRAEELVEISSYQTLAGDKSKKLFRVHEARQKSWCICAPLVVKAVKIILGHSYHHSLHCLTVICVGDGKSRFGRGLTLIAPPPKNCFGHDP